MLQNIFIFLFALAAVIVVVREGLNPDVTIKRKREDSLLMIDEVIDFVNFKKFITMADSPVMLEASYNLILIYENNYKNAAGNVSKLYNLYEQRVALVITGAEDAIPAEKQFL